MAFHELSKSRIDAWRQCPKRARLQFNRRDLLEISSEAEQGLQIVHEVGEVAQGRYPNGVLIGNDDDLSAALASSNAEWHEK